MPPKKIEIPFEDLYIKGLKTLLIEGKTYREIAKYYGVSKSTVENRVKELKESKNK